MLPWRRPAATIVTLQHTTITAPSTALPPLSRCRLGAYRGLGRDNAIARHSAHVIDALPKSAHAGPGAHEQLAEKAAAHSLLLQV